MQEMASDNNKQTMTEYFRLMRCLLQKSWKEFSELQEDMSELGAPLGDKETPSSLTEDVSSQQQGCLNLSAGITNTTTTSNSDHFLRRRSDSGCYSAGDDVREESEARPSSPEVDEFSDQSQVQSDHASNHKAKSDDSDDEDDADFSHEQSPENKSSSFSEEAISVRNGSDNQIYDQLTSIGEKLPLEVKKQAADNDLLPSSVANDAEIELLSCTDRTKNTSEKTCILDDLELTSDKELSPTTERGATKMSTEVKFEDNLAESDPGPSSDEEHLRKINLLGQDAQIVKLAGIGGDAQDSGHGENDEIVNHQLYLQPNLENTSENSQDDSECCENNEKSCDNIHSSNPLMGNIDDQPMEHENENQALSLAGNIFELTNGRTFHHLFGVVDIDSVRDDEFEILVDEDNVKDDGTETEDDVKKEDDKDVEDDFSVSIARRRTYIWPSHYCFGKYSTKSKLHKIKARKMINHILVGPGELYYCDGSVLKTTFRNGEPSGLSLRYFGDELVWCGRVTDGLPHGFSLSREPEGGGVICGQVDSMGQLSGDQIIYIYPDMLTCLVGRFADTCMLSASSGKLGCLRIEDDLLRIEYDLHHYNDDYVYSPSTQDHMGGNPCQRDPYEDGLVEIRQSLMDNGGEGVFAKRAISAGTLAAIFNGTRHDLCSNLAGHLDDDEEIYERLSYTIHLPEDADYFLDIPPAFRSISSYSASLGHKVNHSFRPNCKFSTMYHPRWGRIRTIVTINHIEKGEELFVDYGYDLIRCPAWYRELWTVQNSQE